MSDQQVETVLKVLLGVTVGAGVLYGVYTVITWFESKTYTSTLKSPFMQNNILKNAATIEGQILNQDRSNVDQIANIYNNTALWEVPDQDYGSEETIV